MEQAHGLVIKTSLSRSAKRRSNAALWAMTRAAPLANDATSSASIFRPATISSVMPVIMVIAAEIRSEEHTSDSVTNAHLVCRLLLEKNKQKNTTQLITRV